MASTLWNELDVKPPPTLTCKMASTEVSFDDLRKISDTCWNALTLLKNQQTLFTEAATISRLIYRMRNMFRGDKGFKSIQKVNQCLRHFLTLNLVPVYDNFFRAIPWDCSDKEIYCPTRQMLEHVLLRTQGLAALLCRVVHTCLEAASLFQSRMSYGHNWQVSLLCLGAVSRIWSLAKHILDACLKWYEALLPFLKTFQLKGPSWLPEGYVFPCDLKKWLDVPWICSVESSDCSEINSSGGGSMNLSSNKASSSRMNPKVMSVHDDVGVSLSRESVRKSLTPTQVTSADIIQTTSDEKFCETVDLSRKSSQKRKKKGQRFKSVKEFSCEGVQLVSESVKIASDTDSKNQSSSSMASQEGNVETQTKKKVSKTKNVSKAILSIKSQIDVQTLLDNETRRRSVTSSLGEKQWLLLKNLVSKLNAKLKKVHNESKQQQLLEQIRKAFRIALS